MDYAVNICFPPAIKDEQNEKENLLHGPSGAETFRNVSKYRLPDDRGVVSCHSVNFFFTGSNFNNIDR